MKIDYWGLDEYLVVYYNREIWSSYAQQPSYEAQLSQYINFIQSHNYTTSK
jgi:hypothetical protein